MVGIMDATVEGAIMEEVMMDTMVVIMEDVTISAQTYPAADCHRLNEIRERGVMVG
jgi:hypothetical protein